jgi:hypothetical protein
MTLLGAVSLSLAGSLLLLIAAAAAAVGAAFLFYRFTLPPLPGGRRVTLSLLRGAALALLLLLLFEPVARFTSTRTQDPVIAVLVDNTQSMTIRDAAGDRAAAVRSFLGSSGERSGAVVRFVTFAGKLQSTLLAQPDSARFDGETTNLSAAFAGLKEQIARENIQAVVLVSDGNYTEGKNPLYDAEALGLPVSTVGVGDTAEQKDLLVERVVTNNLAYAETRVPVDVTVKSSGYGGESVEVRLVEGTTVLDRKVVVLKNGTVEYPVSLALEAKEEGVRKYAVTVSELPRELTTRNNVKSFFVKVLRSKLRVLLMAGAPSPDVSAVRQALTEDPQLNVTALVQKGPGEYYGGRFTRAAADSADCIVLVGFPSAAAGSDVLADLRAAVEQAKKPVLYIHGRSVDPAKLRLLEPLLPFSWQPGGAGELLVSPTVAARQADHPLVRLEGAVPAGVWQQLPPVFKPQASFRTKPEAELLVAATLQNIVLNEPLASLRNVNRQKSFALTCYGVWRWRLMTQGSGDAGGFLPSLLANAVRWLTAKEDNKNVRVTPVKEAFTTAEAAEFTGQVYDDQLRPVDDAELIVDVNRGGTQARIALTAVGNGRYEGSVTGLPEGDYTYAAKATGGGTEYGADRGKFSVGQMNVEFLETKMNKPLLEQIAYRTGGTFTPAAGASGGPAKAAAGASFTPKEIVQAHELELWNWQYLAGAIIALLALEWLLRKQSGMI